MVLSDKNKTNTAKGIKNLGGRGSSCEGSFRKGLAEGRTGGQP